MKIARKVLVIFGFMVLIALFSTGLIINYLENRKYAPHDSPLNKEDDSKLKPYYCQDSQRNADLCTMNYEPVCGWFNPAKVQCLKFPCAQTFSNSCFACSNNLDILYWTNGACPT